MRQEEVVKKLIKERINSIINGEVDISSEDNRTTIDEGILDSLKSIFKLDVDSISQKAESKIRKELTKLIKTYKNEYNFELSDELDEFLNNKDYRDSSSNPFGTSRDNIATTLYKDGFLTLNKYVSAQCKYIRSTGKIHKKIKESIDKIVLGLNKLDDTDQLDPLNKNVLNGTFYLELFNEMKSSDGTISDQQNKEILSKISSMKRELDDNTSDIDGNLWLASDDEFLEPKKVLDDMMDELESELRGSADSFDKAEDFIDKNEEEIKSKAEDNRNDEEMIRKIESFVQMNDALRAENLELKAEINNLIGQIKALETAVVNFSKESQLAKTEAEKEKLKRAAAKIKKITKQKAEEVAALADESKAVEEKAKDVSDEISSISKDDKEDTPSTPKKRTVRKKPAEKAEQNA